ncbi:MAG TPA: sugar phosphate nucleotidyltransferase, partial [Candidatus Saccharimonadales bacterium]|nr:sugar phosphate nucleotidyltransferase [Candidatus Saccharimonadales bacterium]
KKYLNDSFFLLSGYHAEIHDFADQLTGAQYDANNVVLLAKEDSILERYGVLEVKGSNVLRVREKPGKNASYPLRVVGMYLLTKEFLNTLEKTPLEHYHFEKALDSYAKEGKVVWTKAEKPTFSLKYAWDLLDAKNYFFSKIKPYISEKATIGKNVLIEGDVYISDGANVLEGVCIKGPCYLGENVIVGNNAILRNGVMAERDVVIGATMEVKNSFLAEGVTTHTGFIGDSIIGPFSRLAAGFCTANVRFDRGFITSQVKGEKVNSYKTHLGTMLGSHVDTGTNVSTMPGIIVGNAVTVGPSTTIMENVEENVLLYTQFETIVKKK